MKKLINTVAGRFITGSMILLTVTAMHSCNKDDETVTPSPASLQSFNKVNLVASDASFGATRVDANLINAWGIAFSPGGNPWISSTGTGTSVVYDFMGTQVLAPVSIPTHGTSTGGIPTGQVFNSTTGFRLPNTNPAKFIFAGIDGIISGWNGGSAAVVVVDRSGLAVYTGLAVATNAGKNYLYAADFAGGKIDVFDSAFALQSINFNDIALPPGYSPFNIQNLGGKLYVMYAKPDPVTHEEIAGPGLGVVNVFNPDGSFITRFVSGGALNAPWGIAQAPSNWLTNAAGTVTLIGNFGDGHINAYDATGNDLGTLQSGGNLITIPGLWALSFAPPSATVVNPDWLYFSAGTEDETKGLFGYITK